MKAEGKNQEAAAWSERGVSHVHVPLENSNFLRIKQAKSLSLGRPSAPPASAEMTEESLMAEVMMAMTPG